MITQLKIIFYFTNNNRLYLNNCINECLLIFSVVTQGYTVRVEIVEGVSRGCTAILRCIVESHVKDLVRVVSWLQEPSFHIYPSLQGGTL